MASWLAAYDDPLFWQFPIASFLLSMFGFLLFATPLTAIAAADPASLRRFRIQNRRPRPQELVGPSLRMWLVNNLLSLAAVLPAWPLLRLTGVHTGPLPAWWVVVGQVVGFIYLDDFLYYWFHRTMHGRWLYKRVHGWHHRIVTPWAVTGHYMHPVEYVLTGTIALIGPMLVGAHVVTLWAWLLFRQWEAAEGHCGYDFPWSPTHWLPFSDGAIHHDVHHARVKGNYSGFLTWCDGAFGTFAKGYGAELRSRHWTPFAG